MSFDRRKQTQLNLETLEDRCTPAVTFSVVGSTLFLNGDDQPNSIVITDTGSSAPNNVTVVADGQGLLLPAVNISIIRVSAGDGDDFVSYTLNNNLRNNRKVLVDLGEDDDVFQGFLQRPARANKKMTMNIQGGDDDDSISVDAKRFGLPNGSYFYLTQDGGDGDDYLYFRYKATITGKIVYNAFGGDDEDTIYADLVAFDGTNDGPSTGRIVANVYGQDDDDAITLLMSHAGNAPAPLGLPPVAGTSPLNGFADGGDGNDNTLVRTANVAFTNFEEVTTVVR
jgi:hypothetical protein